MKPPAPKETNNPKPTDPDSLKAFEKRIEEWYKKHPVKR